MKDRKLLDSFNDAIAGVILALKTQRNMKVHFVMAAGALGLGLFLGLGRLELLLCFTIVLVLVAEMINTSIEAAIDHGENLPSLGQDSKERGRRSGAYFGGYAIVAAYILFLVGLTL